MKRGTTPTITFTLPEEINIAELYITFSQNKRTVLEKKLDDVEIKENVITLPLTQEILCSLASLHTATYKGHWR